MANNYAENTLLIEEFKSLKPADFATLSDAEKFRYLDALTVDSSSYEELTQRFTGVHENLKACLFSLKPSKEFLLTEKAKVNHFLNCVLGEGLDKVISNAPARNKLQKKEDIDRFVNLFCNVYDINKPQVNFENDDIYLASASVDGKSISLAEDFLSKPMQWHHYAVIFHELIHVYQKQLYKSDPQRYKLFSPQYVRLKSGTYMAFLKEKPQERQHKIDEIYALLPDETHAHLMDDTFGKLYNERILKNKYKHGLGHMDARLLWLERE